MKKNRLQTHFNLWVSALCLMLAFQSCNKEKDLVEPSNVDAAANQADCRNPTRPTNPCKTVSLIANNTVVGNIEVATVNGNVLVTYNITAPRLYLSEIHLDAFTSIPQLKSCGKVTNSGCAVPNNFAFDNYWFPWFRVTTYTIAIPKAYVDRLGSDCFFIASHAELTSGAKAWGGLCHATAAGTCTSLDGAKRFPGTSGSVYFEFCKNECEPKAPEPAVDFTYAWEDLGNNANDGDYNDLVMQSKLIKSATELKINFTATARGAAFDHKFKFKIPMAGITDIFGDASHTDDGTYYYITVFESTKAALPANSTGFANTSPQQTDCVPYADKQVTLTINNSFVYNRAVPFEPYIAVFVSGDATVGTPNAEFYVYEISHRDTWTSTANKQYPCGIIIPSDWKWPLERVNITGPYPNFTSLTDGFTANWYTNLANPAQTFNTTTCDL